MERSYYVQLYNHSQPLKSNITPEQQKQIGSNLFHSMSVPMCEMILIKVLCQIY